MPTRKQMLMNAVLTGMGVLIKLQAGEDEEARGLLVNLSSELSQADVDYLMVRFKELLPGKQERLTVPRDVAQELVDACKALHNGIDIMFARLAGKDPDFYPTKSGIPWDAIQKGNEVRAKLAAGYGIEPEAP